MANSLTAVLPSIQQAADMVAREYVGFIGGVYRNSSAERAGLNDTITYDVVPAMTAADITPAATSSSGTDQTIGSGTMSISKSRKVSFHWTGEQQKTMSNSALQGGILQRQFEQAFRTLTNEVESDLWNAAYKGASRAAGTAGTTPFATAADLSELAAVARILDDNGTPPNDRHLVIGSAAMANLRGKQSNLFKVNEAGSEDLLRNGRIGRLEGFDVHYSYPVTSVTKGTGSGYLINMAGTLLVGGTAVTVDTGTGTILAGDIVTFAGTSHKYVVNSALASNVFSIGKPGSLAIEADNDAITVGNDYTPNVAFHKDAIHLITRAPAMPTGGDSADDVIEVTDSFSGLTFQVALYRQYRQVSFEVGLAWGTKAVKSEFIATMIG
jgi:hypothetical protein